MKLQQDHAALPRSTSQVTQVTPPGRDSWIALPARVQGPGGLYNLGNLIALASGLVVQFASAPGGAGIGPTVAGYLFGSPGAAWLSAAMIVFLASGEAYHRAWVGRTHPLDRLNRLGDLLSTAGAGCLTVALVHFGDVALALVAGILLAGGKLGTALLPAGWSVAAKLFRSIVVVSRLPSMAALTLELYRLAASGGSAADAFLPGVTFLCFCLWLFADVLLLRGRRAQRSSKTTPARLDVTSETFEGRPG